MPKAKRIPDCHPEKRHAARGVCVTCYYRQKYRDGGAAAREANRQAMQAFREKNPDWVMNYQRQYSDKNREKINAQGRARYHQGGKQQQQQYRSNPENRARILAKDRAWHKANPEKSAALAKAKKAKRRAAGRVKAADIAAALERQGRICFWCPAPLIGTAYHADHFIPVARGGNSNPENIVASCRCCNLSRRDKLPWEWQPGRFKEGDSAMADRRPTVAELERIIELEQEHTITIKPDGTIETVDWQPPPKLDRPPGAQYY